MSDKLSLPTKRLALRIAQGLESGKIRVTGAAREIAAAGFGDLRANWLILRPSAQELIRQWLLNAHGIDWKTSPEAWRNSTRTKASTLANDEKLGARPVAAEFIQIKPIGERQVTLNGVPLSLPPESHVELPASAVDSLDAEWLLVTENLETFHCLHQLVLQGLPDAPVLAVFRSQPSRPKGLQWAASWSERHGVPIAFFCDLDPAGLVMAQKGAAAMLPDLDALSSRKGLHRLFNDQQRELVSLRRTIDQESPLNPWLSFLEERRSGYTQEAVAGAGITFTWIPLND